MKKNHSKLVLLLLSMCVFMRGCAGITQDRIDECRGTKETAMLADIQALVQSGADLNAQDNNGATLVRYMEIQSIDKEGKKTF